MSAMTVKLPDGLAERLRRHEDRLPEILGRGLRELDADLRRGFEGTAEVLEFLAGLPGPEETLNLRASERFESRVRELLENNRSGGLSPQEEDEWERYEFLEHLVTIAKAKAYPKLGALPGSDD
jgi:hypothetical protein